MTDQAALPTAQGGVAVPLLIDALNVAYWCGSPPSLRLPLSLLLALRQRGEAAVLMFDASARYHFKAESDAYAELLGVHGLAVEVPSGRPADRELLRRATKTGACIISRDRFRDHRRRHRKLIDDPARCLAGRVRDDRIEVDAIGLAAPIVSSPGQALSALSVLTREFL